MLSKNLLTAFNTILDESEFLTKDDIGERYTNDWSHQSSCKPIAVLKPSNTKQVSFILKNCNKDKQRIVVQGGLTGLCGGATPQNEELSVSLEKLNRIEEIDTKGMTMTVQAGVTLEAIQVAADEAGLLFPLNFGMRGFCQIGGNIATNAGGNQVIRYGMTRALVLGLEVVLADGTIISSCNNLLKNNTGYDLKQLFIGSEGTLGIITKAVLRLYPKTKSTCTALCALDSFESCVELLNSAKSTFSESLNSFEVMWDSYFSKVIGYAKNLQSPFELAYPLYVLIEVCGTDQAIDDENFLQFLNKESNKTITDYKLAGSAELTKEFWGIRYGVPHLRPILETACAFDIGISINSMESFIAELQLVLNKQFENQESLIFGHIGDGNLHLIINTNNVNDREMVYELVYQLCQKFSGSISAEHGIGMSKKPYLYYSRSASEVQLMQEIKEMLDPNSILNQGRIF